MEELEKCRLAKIALILSCLSLVFSLLTAIPALIYGIMALVKISKSNGKMRGKNKAITSIVMSSLLILISPLHILLIFTKVSAILPFIYVLF